MNKNDFLNGITMRIIDKLSTGTLPWRRSWKIGTPANFVSKRAYNGINFISLLFEEYPSPYYLTFLQCKEKGGAICKGVSGIPIIFWKILNSDDSEEVDCIPYLRISHVFNLSQTTLYKEEAPNIILECEELIARMQIKPVIKHNIRGCYYLPSKDYISLPTINDFTCKEEYYSALFHEMIHWTGHPTRLNRNASGRYGDNNYAYEELVAEIGSAYLCSICGISNVTLGSHSSYIDGWIKLMKSDTKILLKASNDASKATGFLTG